VLEHYPDERLQSTVGDHLPRVSVAHVGDGAASVLLHLLIATGSTYIVTHNAIVALASVRQLFATKNDKHYIPFQQIDQGPQSLQGQDPVLVKGRARESKYGSC